MTIFWQIPVNLELIFNEVADMEPVTLLKTTNPFTSFFEEICDNFKKPLTLDTPSRVAIEWDLLDSNDYFINVDTGIQIDNNK